MSAITREFTKEQLIEQAKISIERYSKAVVGFPRHLNVAMDLELARIALASLEAEPVAYMYKDKLHTDPRFSLHTRFGNWSQEDINEYAITEIPLFTAPPAPVSVLDEKQSRELFEKWCSVNIERNKWHPEYYAHYPATGQWGAWEACRAAMLHGVAGNSPAIPDGKAPSMEVLTSQMLFDGHTVLEGEFGFIGYERAYEILRKIHSAMLAAAPQQEVK